MSAHWVITESHLADESNTQHIFGHVKKEGTGGPWNAYCGNVFIGEFRTQTAAEEAVVVEARKHWNPDLLPAPRKAG